MPQATIDAWVSLYAAVGLLVAMCAVFAVIKTAHDYRTGTQTLATTTVMDKVLAGGTSRFVIWTAAVGTNGQQKPERCRKVY